MEEVTNTEEHTGPKPPRVTPAYLELAQATPTKRGSDGYILLLAHEDAHGVLVDRWVDSVSMEQDDIYNILEDDADDHGSLRRIAEASVIDPKQAFTKEQRKELVWELEAAATMVTRIWCKSIERTGSLSAFILEMESKLRHGVLIEDKEGDIKAEVRRLFHREQHALDECTNTERIASKLSDSLRSTVKNLLDLMRQDYVQSRYNVHTGEGEFVGKSQGDTQEDTQQVSNRS